MSGLGAKAIGRAPRLQGGPLRDGTIGLVVVLTLGGLLLAQRLKHLPAPVEAVVIKPAILALGPGSRQPLEISFHLDKARRITVEIVSSEGHTIATLVRNLPWPAERPLCLVWYGNRGVGPLVGKALPPLRPLDGCPAAPLLSQPVGRPVPPGEYHLRILFAGSQQPLPLPQTFVVER